MIKKTLGLFILGILGILLNGYVSAYTENFQCAYLYGYNRYTRCYELSPDEPFILGNYNNNLKQFFNFENGDNYNVFYIGQNTSTPYSAVYWNDGKLKSIGRYNKTGKEGYLDKFCVYNGIDSSGIIDHCYMSVNDTNVYNNSFYYYTEDFDSVLSVFGGQQITKFLYTNGYSFSTPTPGSDSLICAIYGNLSKTLCIRTIDLTSSATHKRTDIYTGVNDITTDGINTLNLFSSEFGLSPLNSGGLNGGNDQEIVGIELGSNESAINYFENRYGRNESICYAGIDNVTTNWGSNVSFQEGTGLNIFQVFSGINNMSPDLNKVYVRLNSRLINYEQWFGRSGDPLYLSNYNTGTNQVDLYYDNLTFPFANNPVAVYFLASNISVHSDYSTMGSEIVSYCNLKINDGTFDEIIDQAVKNNITRYTEQENRNNGLSSSGTVINIDFSDLVYTGDAFISSGVEIAFSGNTTLKNTLKEFFTTFDNALDGLDINTTNRILPTWLVSAFLFVVLFNFLRKRK